MRRHQAMVAALLVGMMQTASANHDDAEQPSPLAVTKRAWALKPGDQNYPLLNPSPAQLVQFTAIVPPSLSSDFHLKYFVETNQDAENPRVLHSPPGCEWTQKTPFYIDLPLTLERSGDRYTGSFSPDMFQPGKCRWHLFAIDSPIANSWLVFFNQSLHQTPHPLPGLDLTADVRHLWCAHRNQGRAWAAAPNQSINCVPFEAIGVWTELPNGFVNSVPIEETQPGNHIITQYLKTLSIELYDVDVSVSDYLKTGDSTGHRAAP